MGPYPVKIDGKFGFIDAKGGLVIEPRFTTGSPFFEGRAFVDLGVERVCIDERGDIVFKPRVSIIGVFQDGRCLMRENGKHGFIDRSGNIVIPPRYDDAYDFKNGYAITRPVKDKPARLVDVDGRMVMEDSGLNYKSLYTDGVINLVTERNGRTCAGFVDMNKQWVIEPEYAEVYPFHEGLAAVRHMRTGRLGFIDRRGMFRIEAKFDGWDIWFSEGLCPVSAGGCTGFIDHDGRVAIDATIYYAEHFSCGRSRAYEVEDGKEGFIDRTGKWVVEPTHDYVMPFEDGVAVVDDGYIDLEGNYIWRDRD